MELPWGDEELFGEALALFADWEDNPCAVANAHDGETAPPVVNTSDRHCRPVKRNLSRARQKQEIQELQTRVVELQAELERLRVRSYKRPRVREQDDGSKGTIVAWENAAHRQFQSRRKAEAMNEKLRAMLTAQRAVAQDLIRVLQRADHMKQDALELVLSPVDTTPGLPLDDPVSDQQLRRRLMAISTQWHVPFAKCDKFHDRPDRRRELHFYDLTTSRDAGDMLVLDIRASTPVAFSLRAVEDVLWQYFLTLRCSEDNFSLASTSRESVDTLVGCIRASVNQDGVQGVLDSRFMKQRFRNIEGELVIATASSGKLEILSRLPASQPHARLDAALFEDSWLRVFRVESPTELQRAHTASSSSGVTVIQHVRRSRIHFKGDHKPEPSQVDMVETFFKTLAQNELRWSQEVMERSLILAEKNLLRS